MLRSRKRSIPTSRNDEKARLLLMGWAEGLRGKALRELLDIEQAKLDAVAKLVRRVMERHYPNGWHR